MRISKREVRLQCVGLPSRSIFIAALALFLGAQVAFGNEVSFSKEIAPIFQRHCVGCHKEGKAKGKYRMDTYSGIVEELVAGSLEESEIFHRITTNDTEDRMPAEADPLPQREIDLIRSWIEQGAKYDAEDPQALLATIVPMEKHPAAPESYARPLPMTAMVFAKDGQELVTGGYHELLVWDPEEGRLLRRIPDNGQRTYDLAVSPDGNWLAAATGSPGQTGELRIFEAASGKVVATPFRGDDIVLCVAFDPAGGRVAFGGADGKLRVLETGTWTEVVVIPAHSDWVNAVAWDKDGNRIATASRDKSAKVFDLSAAAGGKRLATFSGHSEPVRGVAFHPGGNEVISCGDQGLVLRWKIADGKKTGDLARLAGPALKLVESDAGYFAAGPDGVTVQLQRGDQKKVRDLRIGSEEEGPGISECALSANRLAVGTFAGQVVFFELTTGAQGRMFPAIPGG